MSAWLAERGLALSTEKTRIVHLSVGFDFLGFNIRQYQVSNSKSGDKLLIKPSKQSVKSIRQKLRAEWRQLIGHNALAVVRKLNPIIRGQANYYRIAVAAKTFKSLDRWMYERCVRYAKRNHPHKSAAWRKAKYWGQLNKERKAAWVFGDKPSGADLLPDAWFKIRRHILVRGASSVDEANLQQYWAERSRGKSLELTGQEQRLARKQNDVCPLGGVSLFNEEERHQPHVQPRKAGGANTDANNRLVHLYCHQQIHSGVGRSADAKGQPLLR